MKGVSIVMSGAFMVSALVFAAPAMAHDELSRAPVRVVAPGGPRANARPHVEQAVLYRKASSRVALMPVEDRAVPRGTVPEGHGNRDVNNRGFNGGFAFGGVYRPFWPGFTWAPYGYGPWWPGYYGFGNGYYGYSYAGGLKLKITGPNPKRAEVLADGAYVGTVDDFNGTFQQLSLRPGAYNIEIRARGYQPLTFKVRIQPDRTITYRRQMEKVA